MDNINNIHIAVIGCISAGKSTFINGLLCDTISEMKRKATTMNPQIYRITKDKSLIQNNKVIIEQNKKINQELSLLRQQNKLTSDKLTESMYFINEIPDFVKPPKDISYSLLDMAGLNDASTEKIYYDYVESISKTIDIYIIVIDLNSGCDTSGEIKVLEFVKKQIQKNKNGSVHILVNKCDNITFDKDYVFEFANEEEYELYTQIENKCNDIFKNSNIHLTISPICANQMYIYRSIKYNPEATIEMNHLDTIIQHEIGKKAFKDFDTYEKKKKWVLGKMKSIFNGAMLECGYLLLIEKLKDHFSMAHTYVVNHAVMELPHCFENNHITSIVERIYDLLQIFKKKTYNKTILYDEIRVRMTAFLSKEFFPWVGTMHKLTNYKECFNICNNMLNKMKEINKITSDGYLFYIDNLTHLTNYFRLCCMDDVEECLEFLQNAYININTLFAKIDSLLLEKKITTWNVLRIVGKYKKYYVYNVENVDVHNIAYKTITRTTMLLYLLKYFLRHDIWDISPIIINDILSQQINHVETLYIMNNILDLNNQFCIDKSTKSKESVKINNLYVLFDKIDIITSEYERFKESYDFFKTLIVTLNEIFDTPYTEQTNEDIELETDTENEKELEENTSMKTDKKDLIIDESDSSPDEENDIKDSDEPEVVYKKSIKKAINKSKKTVDKVDKSIRKKKD
uniref:Dynamin N-terminal domain-containing protein n=1 Tax=viral metagenome TaxID=1070528 RepID=A0A6C0ECI3_9ZZZZ